MAKGRTFSGSSSFKPEDLTVDTPPSVIAQNYYWYVDALNTPSDSVIAADPQTYITAIQNCAAQGGCAAGAVNQGPPSGG